MSLHKTKKDELAKRDLKLIQLNEEIKNKKTLILKKKKEIEKKKSNNTYLEKVSKDYDIYHNNILEQKQNEFKAMNILNEYMLDLLNTNKLFDNQLRLVKYDQKEITNEINKIKDELDHIKNKIK